MKTLGICAAVLMLAAPAAALAGNHSENTTTAKVSYADLDLSRAADAQVMMNRLDRASMKTCGASQFSLREVRDAVRKDACYQDSLSNAVASLNAPSVTAIYRERTEMRLASN